MAGGEPGFVAVAEDILEKPIYCSRITGEVRRSLPRVYSDGPEDVRHDLAAIFADYDAVGIALPDDVVELYERACTMVPPPELDPMARREQVITDLADGVIGAEEAALKLDEIDVPKRAKLERDRAQAFSSARRRAFWNVLVALHAHGDALLAPLNVALRQCLAAPGSLDEGARLVALCRIVERLQLKGVLSWAEGARPIVSDEMRGPAPENLFRRPDRVLSWQLASVSEHHRRVLKHAEQVDEHNPRLKRFYLHMYAIDPPPFSLPNLAAFADEWGVAFLTGAEVVECAEVYAAECRAVGLDY